MTELASLSGQILDAKYRLAEQLGQGGMGAVFRATHLGTDRVVALKVIVPGLMDHREFVARFQREAKAAGRLRHPNIVDLTDFGFAEVGGRKLAYLVMEFLEGETLAEVLRCNPQPPLPFVVDVLQQVCSALQVAHEKGIVHRDLKPDNLWLEPNRRGGSTVKILDFGLAKLYDPKARAGGGPSLRPEDMATRALAPVIHRTERSAQPEVEAPTPLGGEHPLTEVGVRLGTPAYMSPEQCRGVDLDHRSDIYSLGVIVYQMLSGRTPFQGGSLELINKHIQASVPPLRGSRRDLPEGACALVMRAMEKDPALRPASAETFGEAFSAYCESPLAALKEVMDVINRHGAAVLGTSLAGHGLALLASVLLVACSFAFSAGGYPLPIPLAWGLGSMWGAGIFLGLTVNASALPPILFHGLVLPLRPIDPMALLKQSRPRIVEHLRYNLRLAIPLIVPLALMGLGKLSEWPGSPPFLLRLQQTLLTPTGLIIALVLWGLLLILVYRNLMYLPLVPPILLVEDCTIPQALARSMALKKNPLTRFRSHASTGEWMLGGGLAVLFFLFAALIGTLFRSMATFEWPWFALPVVILLGTALSTLGSPLGEMLMGYRYLRLRRMAQESLQAAFRDLRLRMEAAKGGMAIGRDSRGGFVRYEFSILAALAIIILAVVLPRLLHEGWKRAALALLLVLGVIAAIVALFMSVIWIVGWFLENSSPADTGWKGRIIRGTGHLARFSLSGFVGLVVATAIVAHHRLGSLAEAAIPLIVAAASGSLGILLHRRLGSTRFWQGFGKLALALIGSLFGGIFGILGPEPWAVDIGILAPIVVFVILAALGWILPRRATVHPNDEAS